jgi:hypothetical protein
LPADKHVLILSDHGMGWPGGWSDPAPGGRGDPSIPLAAALGDELYLMELDEALGEIRDRTGLEQFELIGLDACLMGHLEVLSVLAPHARYAVASQETELAQQMGRDITLTAYDLAAIPELQDSLNDLAFTLQGTDQALVARARNYAQSFTSIFGKDVPPSYIDLGNFVQLLKRESASGSVAEAADRLLASIDGAIVAERHGPEKPGATGVSIYFPNSQLYRSPVAGPQSYTAIARRFADQTLWDDFLAYHYAGRAFEPAARAAAVPEPGTAISGPGAGPIEVSPITLSDNVAAPGRPVLLSIDIRGEKVGYVYLWVGFYDQESNSILMADMDYLESDESREVNGVFYPDWGEGQFTLEFEWEPLMFAIGDGENSVLSLFSPERYGASPEEAVYTVEGVFTYADGGEARYARLYFRDGMLRQVYGFTGEGGTGAPREIIPQAGDTFTVLERWLDLDTQGRVQDAVLQPGETLTFGDRMFTWEELDAATGEYVVGFIVEDLDGNRYEVYERVAVE